MEQLNRQRVVIHIWGHHSLAHYAVRKAGNRHLTVIPFREPKELEVIILPAAVMLNMPVVMVVRHRRLVLVDSGHLPQLEVVVLVDLMVPVVMVEHQITRWQVIQVRVNPKVERAVVAVAVEHLGAMRPILPVGKPVDLVRMARARSRGQVVRVEHQVATVVEQGRQVLVRPVVVVVVRMTLAPTMTAPALVEMVGLVLNGMAHTVLVAVVVETKIWQQIPVQRQHREMVVSMVGVARVVEIFLSLALVAVPKVSSLSRTPR